MRCDPQLKAWIILCECYIPVARFALYRSVGPKWARNKQIIKENGIYGALTRHISDHKHVGTHLNAGEKGDTSHCVKKGWELHEMSSLYFAESVILN